MLRNGKLLYFKSIEDSHAAGTIQLSEVSLKNVNLEDFSFQLEANHRVYWLKATSETETSAWVSKLEQFTKKQAKSISRVQQQQPKNSKRSSIILNKESFGTVLKKLRGSDKRQSIELPHPKDDSSASSPRRPRKRSHSRSRSVKISSNEVYRQGSPLRGSPRSPQRPLFVSGKNKSKAVNRSHTRSSSVHTRNAIVPATLDSKERVHRSSADSLVKMTQNWGYKPTLPSVTISPFGTLRTSTPKDRPRARASICVHRIEPVPQSTGQTVSTPNICEYLELFDEQSIKWKTFWFVLYPTSLNQYQSKEAYKVT